MRNLALRATTKIGVTFVVVLERQSKVNIGRIEHLEQKFNMKFCVFNVIQYNSLSAGRRCHEPCAVLQSWFRTLLSFTISR